MEVAWDVAIVAAAIIFACFVFVIAFGAPYLPTLKPQLKAALDLMDLKPGQTMLELGSGDGRILAEAAKRGWTAIGYELNPLLALYSWVTTRKYGNKVRVVWGNYWLRPLPKADGIFVFLLEPYMAKLDKKITEDFKHPVKLVSFAFDIPHKKPAKKRRGLFLYEYK